MIQNHLFFFPRKQFNFRQPLFRVGKCTIKNGNQASINLLYIFTGKYLRLIMPFQLKLPMNIPVGSINMDGERRGVIRRKMVFKIAPGFLDIWVSEEIDIQEINRINSRYLPEFLQKQIKRISLVILQNIIHLFAVLHYKIPECQLLVCFYPKWKCTDKHTDYFPMVHLGAIMIVGGNHHVIRTGHPRDIDRKG